jgi:signal transduction histidine kinase
VERKHEEMERSASERVELIKWETDRLEALLQSNIDLTRQDKELTEQVAALTREIHAALTKRA